MCGVIYAARGDKLAFLTLTAACGRANVKVVYVTPRLGFSATVHVDLLRLQGEVMQVPLKTNLILIFSERAALTLFHFMRSS